MAVRYFLLAEKSLQSEIISFGALPDLFRVYSGLGKALYYQGIELWKEGKSPEDTKNALVCAKSYLIRAEKIVPFHYRNTYMLAVTEDFLERIHKILSPQKRNPHDAAPYYETAISLRPAGIAVRLSLLRYLDFKKLDSEIPEILRQVLENYPASYKNIKKESFFRYDLLTCMELGLKGAIKKEINPGEAFKALSDICFTKNEFGTAISYLGKSKKYWSPHYITDFYLQMGLLCLKNNDHYEGLKYFKKALKTTKNIDGSIYRIYAVYQNNNMCDKFLQFSLKYLHQNYRNSTLDMCVARCCIKLKEFERAKSRLLSVNKRHPHAPAHYLLATIAQKEKDWDQVEIESQKAVTLDPNTARYHLLFLTALEKQKKTDHAREAVVKALDLNPGEERLIQWKTRLGRVKK